MKCKDCRYWLDHGGAWHWCPRDDEPDLAACAPMEEAVKAEAENVQLRQAIKAMYSAKSKSEYKRICSQAGVDWFEK